MEKRPKIHKTSTPGFYKDKGRIGQSGTSVSPNAQSDKLLEALPQGTKVFVGPCVEGGDAEYILIASGKVSPHQKPSFAR
ncbi:hypothetical protein [Bacillus sp. 3255]|uniref:hypothetical protein n=1 Tax=Bacillus sp. 3255 TaxID=2817904 RepID=UPI0028602313|nr:hypothetical protein [Bacillus sp. 3255]MDR6884325.1 hypothetical protein [Bacillus sp. 3255]